MRSRSHTTRNALAALLALAMLAVLWQLRPGLPALPTSWTAPMSSTQAEEILFWVVWLVLAGLLLLIARGLLAQIARTIRARREQELEAFAERVLPDRSPPAPPAPSRYPIYADRYVMTLAPRPNPNQQTAPAQPAPTPVAASADTTTSEDTSSIATEPLAPSVSLLGPLKIEGLTRPLKRVPTREMIAYLALHPAGASREELIDAIWPGHDPQNALQRLYQSATEARKALGEAWVRDGERYQLDRTRIRIDLDELDRLLATNDPHDEQRALEAALALWRGAPLAGCDYLWADGDIHRLHATLLELLGRVSQTRLEAGDARGALQAAEQAIRIDNLHEASWRLALQAEHALGLRGSLTKRYEALSHILDEQLGLQPSHDTRMMYRQLLGQT